MSKVLRHCAAPTVADEVKLKQLTAKPRKDGLKASMPTAASKAKRTVPLPRNAPPNRFYSDKMRVVDAE